MDPTKSVVQLQAREESLEPTTAKLLKTDTIAEYSARYERRPAGEEIYKDISLDYWLSEEEDEDATHQLKRPKWKSQVRKETYVVQNAKGPKLRPAEDVLNRLQWDPNLDVADFTIGYLERFDGIKEMPITMWIRETTDEDFIPQHRIKYFKRNSDTKIVWDREERIDQIFGSGLTGRIRAGIDDKNEDDI